MEDLKFSNCEDCKQRLRCEKCDFECVKGHYDIEGFKNHQIYIYGCEKCNTVFRKCLKCKQLKQWCEHDTFLALCNNCFKYINEVGIAEVEIEY
jgi:hypothetical protein